MSAKKEDIKTSKKSSKSSKKSSKSIFKKKKKKITFFADLIKHTYSQLFLPP